MNNITTRATAALLSMLSFGAFAQTVTAVASTLDDAEAKIANQAKQKGAASYKITKAYTGNQVHMTAELNK